jgi:hypothetical protein
MQINPQAHRGGVRNLLLMGTQCPLRLVVVVAAGVVHLLSSVFCPARPSPLHPPPTSILDYPLSSKRRFYFATIECRGPPPETLSFPVVDTRTSGEQLVLLQGAHVSDSQPIALSLFRLSPPACRRFGLDTWASAAADAGRSLLLLHYPSPTPQADLFSTTRRQSPNGRISLSTLRIPRPWLPVARSPNRQTPISTSPQALRSLARFSESRPLFEKQYRSIVAIPSNLTVANQRRRRSF